MIKYLIVLDKVGDDMEYENVIEDFFSKFELQTKCSFEKIFGNFNKGELGVLSYLEKIKGQITSGELSNILDVSTARVASILNSLESKKLIIRKCDSFDKRKILISITENGIKLTQCMKNEFRKRIEYLIEKIGLDNLEKYLDLTIMINEVLNNYEEEIC